MFVQALKYSVLGQFYVCQTFSFVVPPLPRPNKMSPAFVCYRRLGRNGNFPFPPPSLVDDCSWDKVKKVTQFGTFFMYF